MSILVDTNLLLRMAQKHHPHCPIALDALAKLRQSGESVCLVPQCIYEFWVVGTRPAGENGLGLTVTEVEAEIVKLKAIFPIQPDSASMFSEWERLVVKYQVIGKNAHDARLVLCHTSNDG